MSFTVAIDCIYSLYMMGPLPGMTVKLQPVGYLCIRGGSPQVGPGNLKTDIPGARGLLFDKYRMCLIVALFTDFLI